MAQQIVDKYPGSDTAYKEMLKESSEIIEQEVESLKKLVRAFSDFARLPDYQPARHDLRQLLTSISKLYQQAKIILITVIIFYSSSILIKSSSLITRTPNFCALTNFDPAFSPANT